MGREVLGHWQVRVVAQGLRYIKAKADSRSVWHKTWIEVYSLTEARSIEYRSAENVAALQRYRASAVGDPSRFAAMGGRLEASLHDVLLSASINDSAHTILS